MSIVYNKTLLVPENITHSDRVSESIDNAILIAKQLPGASADYLVMNARMAFGNSVFSVMATTMVFLLVSAVLVHVNVRRTDKNKT